MIMSTCHIYIFSSSYMYVHKIFNTLLLPLAKNSFRAPSFEHLLLAVVHSNYRTHRVGLVCAFTTLVAAV